MSQEDRLAGQIDRRPLHSRDLCRSYGARLLSDVGQHFLDNCRYCGAVVIHLDGFPVAHLPENPHASPR